MTDRRRLNADDTALVLATIKEAGDPGIRIEAIQKAARLGGSRCRMAVNRLLDAHLVAIAPRSNGKRYVVVRQFGFGEPY